MATLAATLTAARRSGKPLTLAARIRARRLLPDYDPSRFDLQPNDPAIVLPGGRTGPALLCDLLCRRMWVVAIENADEGPVRVDRWDLFSAAADLSADLFDVPTAAMLRAVAGAAEFFGLAGHRQT